MIILEIVQCSQFLPCGKGHVTVGRYLAQSSPRSTATPEAPARENLDPGRMPHPPRWCVSSRRPRVHKKTCLAARSLQGPALRSACLSVQLGRERERKGRQWYVPKRLRRLVQVASAVDTVRRQPSTSQAEHGSMLVSPRSGCWYLRDHGEGVRDGPDVLVWSRSPWGSPWGLDAGHRLSTTSRRVLAADQPLVLTPHHLNERVRAGHGMPCSGAGRARRRWPTYLHESKANR